MINRTDLKINGEIAAIDRIMKAYRTFDITEADALKYLDENLKLHCLKYK